MCGKDVPGVRYSSGLPAADRHDHSQLVDSVRSTARTGAATPIGVHRRPHLGRQAVGSPSASVGIAYSVLPGIWRRTPPAATPEGPRVTATDNPLFCGLEMALQSLQEADMGVGASFDRRPRGAQRPCCRILEFQTPQRERPRRASMATPLPLGVASSASGLGRCSRVSWSSEVKKKPP